MASSDALQPSGSSNGYVDRDDGMDGPPPPMDEFFVSDDPWGSDPGSASYSCDETPPLRPNRASSENLDQDTLRLSTSQENALTVPGATLGIASSLAVATLSRLLKRNSSSKPNLPSSSVENKSNSLSPSNITWGPTTILDGVKKKVVSTPSRPNVIWGPTTVLGRIHSPKSDALGTSSQCLDSDDSSACATDDSLREAVNSRRRRRARKQKPAHLQKSPEPPAPSTSQSQSEPASSEGNKRRKQKSQSAKIPRVTDHELLKAAETYEKAQPRFDEPKPEAELLLDEQIRQQEDEIRGPMVPTVSKGKRLASFDSEGRQLRGDTLTTASADLAFEDLVENLMLTPDGVTYSTPLISEDGNSDDDDAVLHPEVSGIAIPSPPPRIHRRQFISASEKDMTGATQPMQHWPRDSHDFSEEQIAAMASFQHQVTKDIMPELSGKPSILDSTPAYSDTSSPSEALGSRFIRQTSISSTPLSEQMSTEGCQLPEGDCRYIFLAGKLNRGIECPCLKYTLNPSVHGTTCDCGHQACYHSPGVETAVEQLKFVAGDERVDKLNRIEKDLESKHQQTNQHDHARENGAGQSQSGTAPIATAFQKQVADIENNSPKLPQHELKNEFQGLFMPSYLPLLDSTSRSERRSGPPEDKMEARLLFDVFLPPPFNRSFKSEDTLRRKRQPSPTPSVESLHSLVDSIFSLASLSSASTAPVSDNALQRVLAVLQADVVLNDLFVELTARTSALTLRTNQSCYDEQRTAKFIRSRARKIAQRIVDVLYSSGSTIERAHTSPSLAQTKAESSEDSGTDEEPDEYHELERFVTNSRSFQKLRDNIRGFLGLEMNKILAKLPFADENQLVGFEESINSGQNVLSCGQTAWSMRSLHHKIQDLFFPKPPIPNGLSRVRWKCPCGETLYDDYQELKPGAAKRMEDYLRRSSYKICAGETKSLTERISNVWRSFKGLTNLVTQWAGILKNHERTTMHGPPNPPELNPPLGSTLLMHLFKHPELAGTKKKCLQKIPRKLRSRLAVIDEDDDAIGWGLQFIEGWSKKRLMYMTALTFGLSSVVVMVLVSILGHDVQNAGAIASFMLSTLTIGIATAQAAMNMN